MEFAARYTVKPRANQTFVTIPHCNLTPWEISPSSFIPCLRSLSISLLSITSKFRCFTILVHLPLWSLHLLLKLTHLHCSFAVPCSHRFFVSEVVSIRRTLLFAKLNYASYFFGSSDILKWPKSNCSLLNFKETILLYPLLNDLHSHLLQTLITSLLLIFFIYLAFFIMLVICFSILIS